MTLAWLWPWAAVALLVAAVALVVVIVAVSVRRHRHDEGLRVFSLDDDLETEHASKLFHQWRLLNRGAVALLPAIAEDRLGVGSVGYGWLRAAPGVGAVVVTALLTVRPVRRHVGRVLLVAVAEAAAHHVDTSELGAHVLGWLCGGGRSVSLGGGGSGRAAWPDP